MSQQDNILFLRAILCEDVRDETNRKHSLMGVFSGDIIVGEFPASLRLAIYAEFTILAPGTYPFEVSINYDGKVFLTAAGDVVSPNGGYGSIKTPGFFLKAEKPADLQINLKFQNSEPIELVSRKILLGIVPSQAVRG